MNTTPQPDDRHTNKHEQVQDLSGLTSPADQIRNVVLSNLNNMHFTFPSGFYRSDALLDIFEPSETYLMFAKRMARQEGREVSSSTYTLYSELKLNQTPREFFEIVDQAIVDSGLSLAEIASKTEKAQRDAMPARRQSLLELRELVLPVYMKLIEQGYSHQDITG